MASRRKEPRWITRTILSALHSAQLVEHGGMPAVRDEGMLDAALNRPRQKWNYHADTDIAVLAAAYVFGIAKKHGFIDGNKRAAFMTAYSFLGLNGYDFDAPETEVVTMIEGVAAGEVSEARLSEWFRGGLSRIAS